jgi:hypothetical protein
MGYAARGEGRLECPAPKPMEEREEKRNVRTEVKENVRLRVQALARSARRRTAV